jgi:hypothetical protein
LIAAAWARPLFDLAQIRHVTYPWDYRDADARWLEIGKALVRGIRSLGPAKSPVYSLTELPPPADPSGEPPESFREFAESVSRFQLRMGVARAKAEDDRGECVRELASAFLKEGGVPTVAKELMALVRDTLGWREVVRFIKKLPREIASDSVFQEQLYFAMGKVGDWREALVGLEQIREKLGDSPERSGLLGGRCKARYFEEADDRKRRSWLDQAIEHYRRGMMLDMNQYYCASNLPRLLKARDGDGDKDKEEEKDKEEAAFISRLVLHACKRAEELGVQDEWLNLTRLGATFDCEKPEDAKDVCECVIAEKHPAWRIETTLRDLRTSVDVAGDPAAREALEKILSRLVREVWLTRAVLGDKVKPKLKEHGTLHRKFRQVLARRAESVESVVAITSSGRESANTAQPGDYIVRNATEAGEMYVIKPDKFEQRYAYVSDAEDGFALYDPKGEVYGVELDDTLMSDLGKNNDVYVEAPWGGPEHGEPQRLSKGDMLVCPPDFSEIYGIARKEFDETYRPK